MFPSVLLELYESLVTTKRNRKVSRSVFIIFCYSVFNEVEKIASRFCIVRRQREGYSDNNFPLGERVELEEHTFAR